MKEDISQKILEKIEKDKIEPTSKAVFLLRDFGIALGILTSFFIGSLCSAYIIFVLSGSDITLYYRMGLSLSSYIVSLAPFLPLFLLLLLSLSVYLFLIRFRSGYRYTIVRVLFVSIGLFIFSGIALHFFQGGRKIDDISTQIIPRSESFLVQKERAWLKPDEGVIIGSVVEIGERAIFIEDVEGKVWGVGLKDFDNLSVLEKITPGKTISVQGVVDYENDFVFAAKTILPIHKLEKFEEE
jgi:hypothetical protein